MRGKLAAPPTSVAGDTGGPLADPLAHIDERVLNDLAETIKLGECVAFIGAGFSADASVGWRDLVTRVIDRMAADGHLDDDRASVARSYIELGRYDDAASAAIDGLDQQVPDHYLRDIVVDILTPVETSKRDRMLAEIPFRALLTTNYDGRPGGLERGHEAYRQILRGTGTVTSWLDGRDKAESAVALHGQLDGGGPPLVLTRRQYRDLLYRSPGYRTFLRALFATTTVLFLGKSFDDAYLNELRGEILSLIGESADKPLAYAAVPAWQFTEAEERHLRQSEGIQLLRWGDETEDYSGFDALLEAIRDRTNFFRVMQADLAGLHLLWLDTNASGTWGSADVDATIHRIAEGRSDIAITRVRTIDDAAEAMASNDVDFVISNWGHKQDHEPVAVQLLGEMHRKATRRPVVVFAAPGHEGENRAAAISAGAYAFTTSADDLFRAIHELAGIMHEAMPRA